MEPFDPKNIITMPYGHGHSNEVFNRIKLAKLYHHIGDGKPMIINARADCVGFRGMPSGEYAWDAVTAPRYRSKYDLDIMVRIHGQLWFLPIEYGWPEHDGYCVVKRQRVGGPWR